MARGTDHIDQLSRIGMFSACGKKDLKAIAKKSEERAVAEGEVLIEQDTPGREFFLIMDGSAKVSRNKRKVAELGAGDYFGELALLDDAPRNATVTATSDMTVLTLDRKAFDSLISEVPTLGFKLATGLARRLRESDQSSLH